MEISFEVDPGLEFQFGRDVSKSSRGTEESLEVEAFESPRINPLKPTPAKPGSEEKVLMLSARYAAGTPLWHQGDCDEHGPQERELKGSLSRSEEPTFDLDAFDLCNPNNENK